MSGLAIKSEPIRGIAVYGVPQFDYALDGAAHQDFDTIVADVSMHQASIVEQQTGAVSAAIRLRQRAASDLGEALAKLSGLLCRFKGDPPQSSDRPDPPILVDSPEAKELIALQKRLKEYGYDLVSDTVGPTRKCCKTQPGQVVVTRGVCMKAQTRVQELVDLENNNIQQDMNTLNGFVSKRDKAYNNAAKVVKKYEDTAVTIIKAMNG